MRTDNRIMGASGLGHSARRTLREPSFGVPGALAGDGLLAVALESRETDSSPIANPLHRGDGRLIPWKLAGRPVSSFRSPVTHGKLPKLYIVKDQSGQLVYVGYTRQQIAPRFRICW